MPKVDWKELQKFIDITDKITTHDEWERGIEIAQNHFTEGTQALALEHIHLKEPSGAEEQTKEERASDSHSNATPKPG